MDKFLKASLQERADSFYAHMYLASEYDHWDATWSIADIAFTQRISKPMALRVFRLMKAQGMIIANRNPYRSNSQAWAFQLAFIKGKPLPLSHWHHSALAKTRQVASNRTHEAIMKGF